MPRSDSDGLHVAAQFYAEGGIDTRTPVHPHNVTLTCVFNSRLEAERALNKIIDVLTYDHDAEEIVYSVTERAA